MFLFNNFNNFQEFLIWNSTRDRRRTDSEWKWEASLQKSLSCIEVWNNCIKFISDCSWNLVIDQNQTITNFLFSYLRIFFRNIIFYLLYDNWVFFMVRTFKVDVDFLGSWNFKVICFSPSFPCDIWKLEIFKFIDLFIFMEIFIAPILVLFNYVSILFRIFVHCLPHFLLKCCYIISHPSSWIFSFEIIPWDFLLYRFFLINKLT